MHISFPFGYALLIGINDNAIPVWSLPDVAKDIAALSAVLAHPQRCAYLPEHVRVLTGKAATKANILASLAWLKEKLDADQSDNETALIYYSGHGFVDTALPQPAYYLIPYDVERAKLRQTALRVDDFAAEIAGLHPHRLLVLLDCCHAGGMGVKDLGAEHLAPFSLPPAWLLGGQKAVAPGTKDLNAGQLMRGQGRAVLNSSRSDESSYIRKDGAMSIFTYHVIEALTGHAPHGEEDKEVTAADLLSHVWRKTPLSAQADWGQPQHPDGQISGNFAIALLLGGEGAPAGKALPDPLAPLPGAGETDSYSVFDQRGQTVHGPQTNINGNVTGPVLSGNFKGPVNVGNGKQITVGDINANGGSTVNIAGRDVVQKTTDNSIKVGDISNSTGIAIGHNAQAEVYQTTGLTGKDIDSLFAPLMQTIKAAPVNVQSQAVQKAEELKGELGKGEKGSDSIKAKLIEGLVELVPGAASAIVSIFATPVLAGLAGPVTKYILDKIQNK